MGSGTKHLRERMKLSLVGLRGSCGHEATQSATKVPGVSVALDLWWC